MDEVLKYVLLDNNSFNGYDSDYITKLENYSYREDDLPEQKNLADIYKVLLDGNHIDKIIESLSSIKKESLYKSYMHGLLHNERVLFYTYAIALNIGVDPIDLEILLDAAKYHDIGRQYENEDTTHGMTSADRIQTLVDHKKIYEDPENINLLRCIVDFHSTKDYLFNVIAGNREVKDLERARKLSDILKDADALDLVRLCMGKMKSIFNPNFLRTDEAKTMVRVAHQLNEVYLHYLRARASVDSLDGLAQKYDSELYFHGIGSDFFKLESILDNGILSSNMQKKQGINSVKNYDGYNFGDFISVACYGIKYYSKKTAFDVHIKDKISFCIADVSVFEGMATDQFIRAEFESKKGYIPLDRGEFSDERFVKDMIPLSKIKEIVIPKEMLNTKISELNYMMCNGVSSDIIARKTNYFTSTIEARMNTKIEDSGFDECMNMIKSINDHFIDNYSSTGYSKSIRDELLKLNQLIGRYLSMMYAKETGKEEPTVDDVMSSILSKRGLSISYDESKNYATVDLNNLAIQSKSL